MTLLIVITNDEERNASRGLVLLRHHTAAARTPPLPDLSEEMIMEILLRLPARTLVSLRSVCTSWKNLISGPEFTRNHLRRSCLRDPSLTPLRIACYNSWPLRVHGVRYDSIGVLSVQSIMDNPSEPTKVDHFRGQRYYRMVGSCHGFLCFFDEHNCQNTHGILWNPCTGFTFQSPQISGQTCLSGFGYDHLSDTYKLYGITRKKVSSGFESSTRIYTFGPTSEWRRIDDIPFALLGVPINGLFMADNKEGVFFDSNRACTINWSLYHHVVLYLDLGKEIYGHFPLPDTDSDDHLWRRFTHLYVLRNCLSVCYEHINTHWIVWQMKEYGDAQSWTKLAMVPFRAFVSTLQPLYISENDVLLALLPSFKIVLCDLNDGSIDFPVIDSSGDGTEKDPYASQCLGSRMAYVYQESLVSPNGLQSNSSEMLLRFIKPKPIVSW